MLRGLFALGVMVLVSGCASSAKLEGMVANVPPAEYHAALVGAVEVAEVEGGKSTNPLWMTEISNDAFLGALSESLAQQGLLGQGGRYQLQASIVSVQRPIGGLHMSSTAQVFYRLLDTRTGEAVLADNITATHTARMGEAFLGATRLRLAIEGAARENIRLLLERLGTLGIDEAEVSLSVQ